MSPLCSGLLHFVAVIAHFARHLLCATHFTSTHSTLAFTFTFAFTSISTSNGLATGHKRAMDRWMAAAPTTAPAPWSMCFCHFQGHLVSHFKGIQGMGWGGQGMIEAVQPVETLIDRHRTRTPTPSSELRFRSL